APYSQSRNNANGSSSSPPTTSSHLHTPLSEKLAPSPTLPTGCHPRLSSRPAPTSTYSTHNLQNSRAPSHWGTSAPLERGIDLTSLPRRFVYSSKCDRVPGS